MKKIVFPFLCILMIGLTSCSKESGSSVDYAGLPVIVRYSSEVSKNVIQTPIGTFLAPDLPNEYVDGDMLWVDFTIDQGNQPDPMYITVSKLVIHNRISSTFIKEVPGGDFSDDYTTPINGFSGINGIDNVLFLKFKQVAPSTQTFEYEILYDPEVFSKYPILYIKAKKTNEASGPQTEIMVPYGFDLSSFLLRNDNPDHVVYFYVKVLSGIEDGKEVYTNITAQPITWHTSE